MRSLSKSTIRLSMKSVVFRIRSPGSEQGANLSGLVDFRLRRYGLAAIDSEIENRIR
jgi:hypothetical protein